MNGRQYPSTTARIVYICARNLGQTLRALSPPHTAAGVERAGIILRSEKEDTPRVRAAIAEKGLVAVATARGRRRNSQPPPTARGVVIREEPGFPVGMSLPSSAERCVLRRPL